MNTIKNRMGHALWVFLIVILSVMVVGAQETDVDDTTQETTEEELSVIPYFQSYSFNVPVVVGWDNQSTDEVAYFVNEDLQSSLRVEVVDTNVPVDGIDSVLRERFGDALPDEPNFINTVNLADGAWVQEIYHLESGETVSALANVQNNRSHVISFVEENDDADTYMLIVERENTSESDDSEATVTTARSPEEGVLTAIETLITAEFDRDAVVVEDIELPSGTWTRYQYESPEVGTITAFGFVFGRATYATITTKDDVDGAELANAFNTVHLGFFTTPDNRNYLILGLIVSIGTLAILVLSLFWRWRGIRKDMALLEELRDN